MGAAALALPIVLNEVAYDPDGPDAGAEYVELLHVGSDPVRLDGGWRLERGNGARAHDWTSFWTGDGTLLAPGERLVVGDHPEADIPATPALQNGPDAVRLVGPGGLDVVGWGPHEFPEYVEGAPVADLSPGLIARRPDGHDSDHNANDWWPGARPTPGRVNFPEVGLLVETDWPVLAPSLPTPGHACSVRVVVTSVGLEAVPAGFAGVEERVTGRRLVLDRPLAPGARLSLQVPLPGLTEGERHLVLSSFGPDPVAPPESLVVRVGSGDLLLNEIQARPEGDEPEWVEILARAPVTDGAWRIEDRTGGTATFAPPPLPEGTPFVLTHDAGALLAVYSELELARVVVPDGWASLNDGEERLLVVGPGDLLHDVVEYVDAADGVSFERVHPDLPSTDPAAWVPAPAGATPGAANGALSTLPHASTLAVIPPVVGRLGSEVRVHLGDEAGALVLHVVDPRGRVRGVLLERQGSGRTVVRLDDRLPDGTRLPPGLYVLVARFLPEGGGLRERRTSFAVAWEEAP
jgi:hypothetical protein